MKGIFNAPDLEGRTIKFFEMNDYADSLSNGYTEYAYPVNPYLTGGYLYIVSEIRDELADKINMILGEKFVVSNLRNKDKHQEDAIIIKRKEEN